ncbi:MAG: maltose alpha-D-glucosyltransferase [Planctomycetes bacterium]|nr:maltose alpha-D-glucosyltransferase [Planctomycetota bacterium]
MTGKSRSRAGDSLWYRDAVIYEVHVRAFFDSAGDGVGDFRGLAQKLDYLQDLGVTALWLLPFYPSPLRDDGYDIASYRDVHPLYGTLRDFRAFLREAHRRGLRVITELVINHTSDQHPWFQAARRAPAGSRTRDFYVWSDRPDRYAEARIIFKDFEPSNWTWDPVAKAYYWHRFYAHQPDLNFANPAVQREVLRALDYWLGMGVDGLRLDAIPYLFEREGTNCENLPETHAFLKELRRHVDRKHPGRMLLAEANQWPEDAVAYFGQGDECHMAFHFPIMPRLFMAIHMEDSNPVEDILAQTPPIPAGCQWALFLRNHDELTLEMVTDEERDYMYRVYAHDPQARINLGIRRRLAPLLGNHRRKIELMNGLLLSLPGTPVIYYGDELGMGDNIYLGDRNGVRTPMQWSADRNAGFSSGSPQRLYLPITSEPEYHYETVNVEAQQKNPHSLWWWMKRLIALRNRHPAFGRGSIEFLAPENRKVLAFLRRHEEDTLLVVANLSRFVQYVDLALPMYAGRRPVELFGGTAFPAIGKRPYFLTLGPHAFYWFNLKAPRPAEEPAAVEAGEAPTLEVAGGWEALFSGAGRTRLEELLPAYLRTRRWFAGKARTIKAARVADAVPLGDVPPAARLCRIAVEYTDGSPESYFLPLALAESRATGGPAKGVARAALVRLRSGGDGLEGVVCDAQALPAFNAALLAAIGGRRRWRGERGEVSGAPTLAFRRLCGPDETALPAHPVGGEQSNTSTRYGDRLILKLYRRLEPGVNPDLEIGRFLTETVAFPATPDVAGHLEYRPVGGRGGDEVYTLGILQSFVANQGDAWSYTLDELERFFECVRARDPRGQGPQRHTGGLWQRIDRTPPTVVRETCAGYLEIARRLGQRTAELHLALASSTAVPAFAPEPFTQHYQRAVYQSIHSSAGRVFSTLRRRCDTLPGDARATALRVLRLEGRIEQRLKTLLGRKLAAQRIRIHGDFHLGQVLFTGRDFVFIDFEGEPARPISERRIKRSPLRDVAGMLRSFHYAAQTALAREQAGTGGPGARAGGGGRAGAGLAGWARLWYDWAASAYLRAWLACARGPIVPAEREDLRLLTEAFLLEKAIYEVGYELSHRPDWVRIPLAGILELMEEARG